MIVASPLLNPRRDISHHPPFLLLLSFIYFVCRRRSKVNMHVHEQLVRPIVCGVRPSVDLLASLFAFADCITGRARVSGYPVQI